MMLISVTNAATALFILSQLVWSAPITTEDSNTTALSPLSAAERDAFKQFERCAQLNTSNVTEPFASPEWFIKQVKLDKAVAIHNRALFYTRQLSQLAREIADASCGYYVTVWDLWYHQYYECVPADLQIRAKYYEGMSEAFARLARGSGTAIHNGKDYDSPPMDGIYGRVELPTLQKWTDVEELWMTNQNQSRGDRYTIQHSNRWERVAQQNMWRTAQLLGVNELAARDADTRIPAGLVKRKGASCPLSQKWQYDPHHPLKQMHQYMEKLD